MGIGKRSFGKFEIKKELVMENKDFIFGTRAVIEAINNSRTIEKILIKKGPAIIYQMIIIIMERMTIVIAFAPALAEN